MIRHSSYLHSLQNGIAADPACMALKPKHQNPHSLSAFTGRGRRAAPTTCIFSVQKSLPRLRTTVAMWIMDTILQPFEELRQMNLRQTLSQIVNLGLIVTSALIIWKSLMLITGSESPVVVVLSGSMEPGFQRGDILFLNLGIAPVRAGEIVVFNVKGRDIPIVHRVIKVHERRSKDQIDILTKGDNNYGDDRVLYAKGQKWLHREHIMGRAVGYLPYVGMVTIVMNDYPYVKYVLIGILGLLVVTSKE